MELMEENGEVGFEEGRVWLPTHVLDEAFEPKNYLWPQHHHHLHQLNGVYTSLNAVPILQRHNSLPKSISKSHSRAGVQAIRASGGPGMQAFFLESGERSCGTGFFLPRRAGVSFQPSNKPAYSPVLIPRRVIETLNLDVHALGSHLTPRRDLNNDQRYRGRDSSGNENGGDVIESITTSPDIFLPKEWSY